MLQAQCQKDLSKLSKEVSSKEGELNGAQAELQQQQDSEAALKKRIAEAERRLQVWPLDGCCSLLCALFSPCGLQALEAKLKIYCGAAGLEHKSFAWAQHAALLSGLVH